MPRRLRDLLAHAAPAAHRVLVRALQVTPTVAARKPGRKPKKPKPPFTLSLGVTCDVHAILP